MIATNIRATHLWPWGILSLPSEGASSLDIRSGPHHDVSRTWSLSANYWGIGNWEWSFGQCCTHGDPPLAGVWSHVFDASTSPAKKVNFYEWLGRGGDKLEGFFETTEDIRASWSLAIPWRAKRLLSASQEGLCCLDILIKTSFHHISNSLIQL